MEERKRLTEGMAGKAEGGQEGKGKWNEEKTLILEKAVAVTRTPRAEPISLAETRRRGEFESYAGCFMKISLHPIGEGHPF